MITAAIGVGIFLAVVLLVWGLVVSVDHMIAAAERAEREDGA